MFAAYMLLSISRQQLEQIFLNSNGYKFHISRRVEIVTLCRRMAVLSRWICLSGIANILKGLSLDSFIPKYSSLTQ